jgi:hypothetical protein
MEDLMLFINLSPEDQRELNDLRLKCKESSQTALDESDPDPESIAARMSMKARELYDANQRRNERIVANATREMAKRGKEMNSYGFRG